MGCHTWVNKRLNYTREQLLLLAKDELDYQQHHKSKHPHVWEVGEKFDNGDIETLNELIEEHFERVYPHTGYSYRVSTRTGLIYTHHFFDMFRVSGYPEDECHSLRETLNFLAERQRAEKYIWEDENTMPLLEKFWKENPGGMITFG